MTVDEITEDWSTLERVLMEGPQTVPFTRLVSSLSKRLQADGGLEEFVHVPADPSDLGMFLLELNSLLKEMNCPYVSLIDGGASERLSSKEARYLLINFLASELQAIGLNNVTQEKRNQLCQSGGENDEYQSEDEARQTLMELLDAFGFSEPASSVGLAEIFAELTDKVNRKMRARTDDGQVVIGSPLFVGGNSVTEKQWRRIDEINEKMKVEYKIRGEMLHKRLDLTVSSFLWSDRVKKKEDEVMRIYQPLRRALHSEPRITVAHLLAARSDLTSVEKLSGPSATMRTRSKLNKLLVQGRVPDRGGRMTEMDRPAPEMPAWSKRIPGSGGGGGGRGRVQSGWSTGGRGGGQWSGRGARRRGGYR